MNDIYRLATLSLLLVVGSGALVAGCGDENEPECEADDDCAEVVCEDGSKVKSCREGVCFVFEDCDGGGGW